MPPYVFMFLCTHEGFGATFVQIHNLMEVSSKFLFMCSKCVRRVEFARAVSGGAWARGGEGASAEAELLRATRLRPNSGRISPPNSFTYFYLFFLDAATRIFEKKWTNIIMTIMEFFGKNPLKIELRLPQLAIVK